MDENLLNQEDAALNAITTCMTKHFNGKVDYTSSKVKEKRGKEVPVITEQDHVFWTKCIALFKEEMTNRFKGCGVKLLERPVSEVRHAAVSGRNLSSGNKNCFNDSAYWASPMDDFKTAYNELIMNYGFSDEQKAELKELFSKLCKKVRHLDETNAKEREFEGSILGTTNFTYLPFMLDLHQIDIRKLLPYLLTAYTFNVWENRFFYAEKKLLNLICAPIDENTEAPNSSDASKMRPRIKQLSKVFSLKDSHVRPMPKSNRPIRYPSKTHSRIKMFNKVFGQRECKKTLIVQSNPNADKTSRSAYKMRFIIKKLNPILLYTDKSSLSFYKMNPRIKKLNRISASKGCKSVSSTSKIHFRIKRLSRIYGLKRKPKLGRPSPFYTLFDRVDREKIENPYVKYSEVLDQVFNAWREAVFYAAQPKKRPMCRWKLAHFTHLGESIRSANIEKLKKTPKSPSIMQYKNTAISDSDIHWENCHKLYSFYTDKAASS